MTSTHIYPFENVVCAFAALSPRISYRHNCLALAELLNHGDTNLGYGQNIHKAKEILLSDKPVERLSTKRPSKCDSFARAILGDVRAVTLDTWMLNMLGFDGWITPLRYRNMAAMVTQAALSVGEAPRDFQAILWVGKRGTHV
jgi:hypothetical protein